MSAVSLESRRSLAKWYAKLNPFASDPWNPFYRVVELAFVNGQWQPTRALPAVFRNQLLQLTDGPKDELPQSPSDARSGSARIDVNGSRHGGSGRHWQLPAPAPPRARLAAPMLPPMDEAEEA